MLVFQIVGHGINKKVLKILLQLEKFFASSKLNKMKLAPKKWNKSNKNLYRILSKQC